MVKVGFLFYDRCDGLVFWGLFVYINLREDYRFLIMIKFENDLENLLKEKFIKLIVGFLSL